MNRNDFRVLGNFIRNLVIYVGTVLIGIALNQYITSLFCYFVAGCHTGFIDASPVAGLFVGYFLLIPITTITLGGTNWKYLWLTIWMLWPILLGQFYSDHEILFWVLELILIGFVIGFLLDLFFKKIISKLMPKLKI